MLDRFLEYLKKLFSSRLVPIVGIYIILFFVLIIRMFMLQIVDSDTYVDKAEHTEVKEQEIQSTRGKIYDRNGNLLASNELSYAVTIVDSGSFNSNDEKNAMIYNLIHILNKNEEKINVDFGIELNNKDELEFNTDKKGELRFKRDAYFAKSVDDLTEEQKNASAAEVYEYLRTDVSSNGPKFAIADSYSVSDALAIMAIRYNMMINSYKKYIPITIASDVKESTVIAIKESSAELSGVSIEQSSKRMYYDSRYFSNIIGYTGRVNSENLDDLKNNDDTYNYTLSDQIGKTGIELSKEDVLRGTKGTKKLVIDSNSRIIDSQIENEPVSGQDIYLTIDANLQKACYTILEKKLAGILISKINNSMNAGTKGESASDIRIPIYDVYNSLFTNNIIDLKKMASKNASDTQKKVYKRFVKTKEDRINMIGGLLRESYKTPLNDEKDEVSDYMTYIYKMLLSTSMLKESKIDKNDSVYLKYTENKVSLSEFLKQAVVNNWIDFDMLGVGEDFFTTSELFEKLKDYIITKLGDSSDFDKLVYKHMIYNYNISGTEACIICIDQGILKAGENTVNDLNSGTLSPYSFILSKIRNLELTPGMLALDPCSGSIIITDVNNGDVLAYVSYPTYDNNKFANEIDTKYYNSVSGNGAYPLMNRPSMQKTAPGSTFKMVTATAALEESGILSSPNEKILDEHEFKLVNPSPKCWSKSSHGKIDVTDALRFSCNYFFYEVGYRLGLTSNGSLNHEKGLATLSKYAKMFGLGDTSGIELSEAIPKISDYDTVRSAIGQGNHSYTPAGLSRYVTTLANSGTCYNLTLIDKTVNPVTGNVEDNSATVKNNVDISDTTWKYIHKGMRKVITGGSIDKLYENVNVDVAGKTGTAQENDYKPNHALFVSYAPYKNPEISVTTVVPNGYTSGNAAEISRDIYKYYYHENEREKILNSKVKKPENQSHAFSD